MCGSPATMSDFLGLNICQLNHWLENQYDFRLQIRCTGCKLSIQIIGWGKLLKKQKIVMLVVAATREKNHERYTSTIFAGTETEYV